MGKCNFTFAHYRETLILAKNSGYNFSNLGDFDPVTIGKSFILLRHDIDCPAFNKALSFAKIENELKVKATYFIRVHSDAYNPFGFRNYHILRQIIDLGHEVGLHYEHIDFCKITREDPASILKKGKNILELILGVKIKGIAGHGEGFIPKNWDFWQKYNFKDFGFEYDAYEEKFMNGVQYVDDALGKWNEGKCMCKYINQFDKIYFQFHPVYWYHKHFQLEQEDWYYDYFKSG